MDIFANWAWCLREIDGIPCENQIGYVRWVFLANCQHATYWCYLPLVAILCLPTAIPKWPVEPNMNPFSSEPQKWISPLINHEFLLGNLRDIVLTVFFEFRLLRSLFSATGEGEGVQGLERVWCWFWLKISGSRSWVTMVTLWWTNIAMENHHF